MLPSERESPLTSQGATVKPAEETTVVKFEKDPQDPKQEMLLPTLFGAGYGAYEVRPENFLLSVVTHTLAIALMLWILHLATPLVKGPILSDNKPIDLTYPLQVGTTGPSGGGGGARSKLQASRGTPPKVAKIQFAPPKVLQQEQSKLMVQPTVVANLNIPQSAQMGDPLSKLTILSNGVGYGGGIGNGTGGGIGSGNGAGVGPGDCCGNGITAPQLLYKQEPEFSDEARKAKYQGIVGLEVVVGTDGRVHETHVVRSLGMGLDEKAIEAVKKWKFDPAKKDGRPVAVRVGIDVDFRLY